MAAKVAPSTVVIPDKPVNLSFMPSEPPGSTKSVNKMPKRKETNLSESFQSTDTPTRARIDVRRGELKLYMSWLIAKCRSRIRNMFIVTTLNVTIYAQTNKV